VIRHINRFLFLTVLTCALALPCALLAEKAAKDKAVDDYNFAAWLYNQAKYPLAAESYTAFLSAHPDHEKAADARFGLAQSLFYQDKFKEAAAEYEAVRAKFKDFPQMPEVLFQLAQCKVAAEQFADAEPVFAEMCTRFSSHYLADWSTARRAACLVSLQKFKEAEDLLKEFLDRYAAGDKSPADAEATRAMFKRLDEAGLKAQDAFLALVERSEFYLAIARFNQEHYTDARAAFERFLKRYKQSSLRDEAQFRLAQALYQEKSYPAAADAYASVAGGSGEFAESAAFEKGLSLYKAGRLADAAAAFGDMATRFPKSAKAGQASLYAGTFLYEAGNYAGAAARLGPIADAGKEQADEAAYWVGMCLLKQGKNEEAEKQFAGALKAYPKSSRCGDMRLGLGDALLAENKLADAAAAFREFSQNAGSSDQAPRALYSACVALHRADKYQESDDLCGEFLSRNANSPLVPQTLFLSGENRFLSKAYDRAGERYRVLLARQDAQADQAARAHYRLAWVLRYAKDFAGAIDELGKIKGTDAGQAIADEALYLKGVCLQAAGKSDEAADALAAYLKTGDHSRYGDDALLKLAAVQATTGKKDKAADAYERFLRDYPNSDLGPQARYQLAELLADSKQFDKAADQYAKVAAAKPEGDLAAFALFGIGVCHDERSRWTEAIKALDDVMSQYPKSELVPQALYRKARALMSLKRWEDAAAALSQLLDKHAKHNLARASRVSLGYCMQEQKKWKEAVEEFRKAADMDGKAADLPRVLYEQAWSCREAGDSAGSLAAFRDLAGRFPADPLAADANFHVAEALYAEATADGVSGSDQSKKLAEAREIYVRVRDAKGDDRLGDKARYRIGWTCWLSGKYAEAAEAFDQIPEKYPGSELVADALFQAGQSHAKAGNTAKALEKYKTLVENSKYSSFKFLAEAYAGLGDCLIAGGDSKAAVKYIESAAEKYRDEASGPELYFLLGKSQYELQQFDKALEAFQEAAKRGRAEVAARAQFYVGQTYQGKSDLKQALMAYLRIQALYPQVTEWVAAATFESGKCHQGLGANDEARKAFQEVVEKYKGTKWAEMAAQRLKDM
jgi:cellulose synthase operon protein C